MAHIYPELASSDSASLGYCQYADLHRGHVLGLSRYGEFGRGSHLCEQRSHLKPSSLMRAMGFSSASYSPLYTTVAVVRYMLLFTPVLAIIRLYELTFT